MNDLYSLRKEKKDEIDRLIAIRDNLVKRFKRVCKIESTIVVDSIRKANILVFIILQIRSITIQAYMVQSQPLPPKFHKGGTIYANNHHLDRSIKKDLPNPNNSYRQEK